MENREIKIQNDNNLNEKLNDEQIISHGITTETSSVDKIINTTENNSNNKNYNKGKDNKLLVIILIIIILILLGVGGYFVYDQYIKMIIHLV